VIRKRNSKVKRQTVGGSRLIYSRAESLSLLCMSPTPSLRRRPSFPDQDRSRCMCRRHQVPKPAGCAQCCKWQCHVSLTTALFQRPNVSFRGTASCPTARWSPAARQPRSAMPRGISTNLTNPRTLAQPTLGRRPFGLTFSNRNIVP